MVEALTAFYRVKKQKYKDRVYYYLYREWYDASEGKRRSKLIARCDLLEEIINRIESGWCGGWDLNPRRPTPAGLEPSEKAEAIASSEDSFYHSQGQAESSAISGRSDEVIKLTEPLITEFSTWLRSQGTGEKTVKNYTSILRKCLDLNIVVADDFFRCAKLSKKSYEAFRRFITFLEKKGFEVENILKTMPKKPRSGVDTKVPSDEEVLRLREAIAKMQNPVLVLVYNILVSSGCRLSEAYTLVKTFNPEKLVRVSDSFYRYHMDYLRGSKNVYVLYLPSQVVEQIRSARDLHLPHINNIAKVFEKCGLGAKYIRKWFRQTCKKLKVDSEVIEFIQGRVTALGIGAKHYTDLIALADEEYVKILNKIRTFLI